jgi:hypothetical protein
MQLLKSLPDIDESRRRFLVYLLSAGTFAAVPGCSSGGRMVKAMPVPAMMPANKSIYQYLGKISVNRVPATLETRIDPGDVVETGPDSQLVFVVDKDAFLMRSNSRMRIPAQMAGGEFNLERGKVLSVFASQKTAIRTPSAVIAIRGTGVYVEVEPDLSYVCTCYGLTDLSTADNPGISETIESRHHDAPRYILADTSASERIVPAPFKNHDDQELLLIETLVGRTTPYMVPQGIRRTRGPYI